MIIIRKLLDSFCADNDDMFKSLLSFQKYSRYKIKYLEADDDDRKFQKAMFCLFVGVVVAHQKIISAFLLLSAPRSLRILP